MAEAEEVLAARERIELSAQAAEAFATALAEPPRENWELAEALQRPRKFKWVD